MKTTLIGKMVNELGIIFVAAAGNEGNDIDPDTGETNPVEFPAALNTVITVGGIVPNNQKINPSSYGELVEIADPGQDIYTTLNTKKLVDKNNPYGEKTGTYFAAPIVSGIAALILSHLRSNSNKRRREGKRILSDLQLARIITEALYDSAIQTSELKPYFKYVRVDAWRAINNAIKRVTELEELIN